jgi:hypothetical protein
LDNRRDSNAEREDENRDADLAPAFASSDLIDHTIAFNGAGEWLALWLRSSFCGRRRTVAGEPGPPALPRPDPMDPTTNRAAVMVVAEVDVLWSCHLRALSL